MKKNLFNGVVMLLLLNHNLVCAQTKVIPYQELTNYNGVAAGSGMYFGASMTAAGFTLTFSGPADRWIAFGLGVPMNGSDAFIYTCGNPGNLHVTDWKDYKNNSSGTNLDAVQDWTLVSNTVASNQRTVVAYRALNTGDVNDAVITYSAATLDVIWARGAAANYTLASHGTTNRRGFINLTWLSAPTASFTSNTNTVCQGSGVTYSNLSSGGSNSYLWNFQSGSPATSTSANPVVIYNTPGTYSVALTASNSIGTDTYSQINYITVTPTVAPAVAIGISSGNGTICAGSPITFTASSTNGGSAPSYQWKVNGVNTGTNGPVFSSNTLLNNSAVSCVLTSNAGCVNPATAISSVISIAVNSTLAAAVSLAITGGNNPMCSTSSATFAATVVNGGSSPSYQWKKNNVNVGTNSATYSAGSFSNNDIITCDLQSNSACASSTFASSAPITITISTQLTPSVNVGFQNGSNPACAGQAITFTAVPFSGGNTPNYTWYINGTSVPGNGSSLTSTVSNGAQIQCVLISNASCASPNTASSSAISMTVNSIPPIPVIAITGNNPLCFGNTATLSSNATGSSNWSNGTQSASMVIGSAGTYSLSQTINGCTSPFSSAITITVLTLPQVSLDAVPDVCKEDATILLNGTPTGGIFSGNGVSGTSFNPAAISGPSTQVIYQYTDGNGCSDTAAIAINVLVCTGVSENKLADLGFNIVPNPARERITLVSAETEIIVQLFDLLGNKIMEGTQKEVDIKHLTSGIYVVKVYSKNSCAQQRLIVLNE